jgi:cytochrome c553
VQNPALAVPKLSGQDKDYLVMALRAYRDDRRESSTMHRMSLPYSDSIIESIAALYASQPPR